ncbi:hypothetical protein B0H14DRAFT_2639473 [Mycena olivaceomarginata]|nr:hypothetical protein B0H14DRAFT_2639473 [Mycena olivaceomarginata]
MPKGSRMQQIRAGNLLKNLSNLGTKTKCALDELSPKELTKWLSPRKRHKENATVEDTTDIETHQTHLFTCPTRLTPFDASATEESFITSTQCFPIPGLTSESPSSAPAAHAFTWKLPKPTVEEVNDEDDRLSTYTFPAPEPTRPFCAPSSSVPSPTEDFDDPRDSIDIPEAKDELLATSPSHDDDYPRPLASRPFLERMHEQAMREGVCRQAPNLGEAKAALDCVQRFLRGELRGTDLFGLHGVGYKDLDISVFTRNRLIGIRTMLNFYVTPLEGGNYGQWGASARLVAHGLGRGKYSIHCHPRSFGCKPLRRVE